MSGENPVAELKYCRNCGAILGTEPFVEGGHICPDMVSFDVELPSKLYEGLVPEAERMGLPVETLISRIVTDYVNRETEALNKKEDKNV